MNPFLYNFGVHLKQIRELLGLTQVILAEKSGISKPTIVAIEGEPSRLSRAQALALLFVITSELDKRESAAKTIDYSNIASAAAALAAAGFTAKIFQYTAKSLMGGILLPMAAAIAIPLLFQGKSAKKLDMIDKIDSASFKKLANESIDTIRKEIKNMLVVTDLTIPALMAEIEKNESKEASE